MARLCGRAGRLTAKNGGFRPGQELRARGIDASLRHPEPKEPRTPRRDKWKGKLKADL